jgi:trigger factor
MKITVEKLPDCTAQVRVEVPEATVKSTHDAILAGYARQAAIPGFRKGKVPRDVVKKRFREEIEREVADRLANEALSAAVKQENLRVISVSGFKPENATTFTLSLVLAPEIALPEYKGLNIRVPSFEVTDEKVNAVLDRQRESLATLSDADRPVQLGDYLTIDYTATLGGQPLTELLPESEHFLAANSGYLIKATEGSFLPGFAPRLEGMKKGETKEVTLTMPAEGINEAVAGKEVVYKVTVQEIKEALLPELNDEFAARVMPEQTVDSLRELIRRHLESESAQRDVEQKRIAAMVALREKMDFTLPETVVRNATQERAQQLVRMNMERGVPQEVIVENEEDILKAAGDQARVDVKDEFILLEIVAREKLEATREDMVRRVSAIAANARTTPQKVVKALQKDGGLDNLRHSIILAKALDVLVAHANVEVDKTMEPVPTGAPQG